MFLPRTHIELEVDDADASAKFYTALFGAPPARTSTGEAIFEFDSPPLVLTLKFHSAGDPGAPRARARRSTQGRSPALAFAARPRFALVVNEPGQVGDAAVALRRAGVPLRVQDKGIEAHDPDGHGWRVRFEPFARGRAVFAI